jgi:hypothetical protein
MKIGQNVAFKQSVIRRLGYDKVTADMRGKVISIMSGGKVAEVDTLGTYPNEEGNNVRFIPVANLTTILSNGSIFGD